MRKKKTHEEYVNELKEKNPNIEVIGEYSGAHSHIKHRCLIDGYEWDAIPTNILRGHGCPMCSNSAQISHEEYVQKVHDISQHIDVLGHYINSKTKILHRCNIHGIEWYAFPYRILQGSGCKECGNESISRTNSLTQDEYIKLVQEKNPSIEVVGKYINAKTKISHRCKIHDYEWNTVPEVILQGCGCPLCRSKKISFARFKTHKQYIKELKEINKNVIPLDEYKGATEPIKHKCLICGKQWVTTPTNLLSGFGCPYCNESKGERAVRNWLEKNNISYFTQYRFKDCKDQRILPFDFYLPDFNSCIEFDGEQHRRPINYFGGEETFKICVKHDQIKNQYCQDNNIRLLRINNVKDIDDELNNFLLA